VNDRRCNPWLELALVLTAIAVQVFAAQYDQNPDFRYQVNRWRRQLTYRVRDVQWRQGYALLKGWQREAVEQVHGPPPKH
jgi:hypothetical protein